MKIFQKFSSKKQRENRSSPSSRTPTSLSSIIDPIASSQARDMEFHNPFAAATPTRRPKPVGPPPAYSPPSNSAVLRGPMQTTADSPYAFLTQFDTIFLIDDSGSMAGRSWRETSAALRAIVPICTAHDADGIDIYFLNHRNPVAGSTCGALHEHHHPRRRRRNLPLRATLGWHTNCNPSQSHPQTLSNAARGIHRTTSPWRRCPGQAPQYHSHHGRCSE
jgi:hypothetical protein